MIMNQICKCGLNAVVHQIGVHGQTRHLVVCDSGHIRLIPTEDELSLESPAQSATIEASSGGDTKVFPTGAARSAKIAGDLDGHFPLRWDLMFGNLPALERLARTWGQGGMKYPAGNWKHGFPESELFNHTMGHLAQHVSGDVTVDHLAHACWGVMAIMWQQQNRPELMNMTGGVPAHHNFDTAELEDTFRVLAERARKAAQE